MKVIFVFALCVATVLTHELSDASKQKLKDAHQKCQSDPATHIDGQFFKKLAAHEKVDLPANYGAHILCVSKATGLQKEDGSLDKDFIKARVDEGAEDKSKGAEIVEECAVDKDTPEHTALHLFKCFREKSIHYHH